MLNLNLSSYFRRALFEAIIPIGNTNEIVILFQFETCNNADFYSVFVSGGYLVIRFMCTINRVNAYDHFTTGFIQRHVKIHEDIMRQTECNYAFCTKKIFKGTKKFKRANIFLPILQLPNSHVL